RARQDLATMRLGPVASPRKRNIVADATESNVACMRVHSNVDIEVPKAHGSAVRDFACSRLAPCGASPEQRRIRTQDCAKHGRAMSRGAQMPDGLIQGKPDMATGVVKFFNAQRGFGFIQPQDGGKDVFVHISAVERAGMNTLREGQKVSYDVVSDRGKEAAANLQEV